MFPWEAICPFHGKEAGVCQTNTISTSVSIATLECYSPASSRLQCWLSIISTSTISSIYLGEDSLHVSFYTYRCSKSGGD